MTTTEQTTEIEINLNTPNGPQVEYSDDDEIEAVEAEVPAGWRVDWETLAYRLAGGRRRSPLVLADVTDDQIEALAGEAAAAGDLAQVAICQVALGRSRGHLAVTDHEWAEAVALGRDECRDECAEVIADAAAQA